MIKNNKGFMLIEAIVTSVIVVTALIGLYTTFNKLSIANEEIDNYHNIDALYASKHMMRQLRDNNFNKFINDVFYNSQSKILIDKNATDPIYYEPHDKKTSTKDLSEIYNVETMIITEYDKTVLEKEVRDVYNLNQTFKEYIDFVINYYDVSEGDTKYSYIILTEIKEGNNYYYANLGIE